MLRVMFFLSLSLSLSLSAVRMFVLLPPCRNKLYKTMKTMTAYNVAPFTHRLTSFSYAI